jgi:hypothetical protein
LVAARVNPPTGDEVEGVAPVGQRLHVSGPQLSVGNAFTGNLEQRLRGVESERSCAAVGDQAQERADATADVEHELPGLQIDPAQRLLVGRGLLVLAEPINWTLFDVSLGSLRYRGWRS